MADDTIATSASLTLRFKHGYTTTLLYTDPLTPISTLISTLLTNLRERYPLGLPDPSTKPVSPIASTPLSSKPEPDSDKRVKIPEDTSDVKLALMVDPYDSSRGWQEIKLSGGGPGETPKSLGIKDAAAVGYRFVGDEADDNSDVEEDGEGEGEGEGAGDKYQVVWPTYEDAYPEEMDVEEDEDEEVQAMGDRKRKRDGGI